DLFFFNFTQDAVTDKAAPEKLVNLANVAGINKALLADGGNTNTSAALLASAADLLTGPQFVTIQEDDGTNVPADVHARIADALNYWNGRLAAQGVVFFEVAAGSLAADFQIHLGTTSVIGGQADGVLGVTTANGMIELINTWNWYTGADAAGIGA